MPAEELSAPTCLVPLDGSAFAQLGTLIAEELANRVGAEVHLLSAVSRPDEVPRRDRELSSLRIGGQVPRLSVALSSDPAELIYEASKHLLSPVVCLASHGRRHRVGLRPSIPDQLLSKGLRSLILAGPAIGRPKGVWWDNADLSLAKFRGGGVVVCLAGKDHPGQLVATACQWANRLEEPIVALTVAEQVPALLEGDPADRFFGPSGDPQAFLDEAVRPVLGTGTNVTKVALDEPVGPATGILSYLEDHPAALAVAGAHYRNDSDRIALSGTVLGIVRAGPSPLLVVPHPRLGPERA